MTKGNSGRVACNLDLVATASSWVSVERAAVSGSLLSALCLGLGLDSHICEPALGTVVCGFIGLDGT